VLRVDQQQRPPLLQHVIDGTPQHAPHNVAKCGEPRLKRAEERWD
jgi:hypothetical protein